MATHIRKSSNKSAINWLVQEIAGSILFKTWDGEYRRGTAARGGMYKGP